MRPGAVRSLLLATALLSACSAPGAADWIEPSDCDTNTPPAVGNIAVDTVWDSEAQLFRGCFAMEWVDPGVDEAGSQGTDAPNMFGGLIITQFTTAPTRSVWLDELLAPPGASTGSYEMPLCSDDWGPTAQQVLDYPPEEELDQDDPTEWPPDYSACFDWDENGTLERHDCFAGAIINFQVTARDRCDAVSPAVTGSFRLGSIRQVSDEAATGCMAIPPCPGTEPVEDDT